MNLIECFGYEKVKDALNKLNLEKKDLLTIGASVFTKNEVEEILLEYRRANNIFEMGDYIIHKDELMVFAMWSEKLSNCAYIGYAYAEDGFLVKNDEFRHATPQEIEEGKRL